jgi:hypothetical protein
MSMRVTIRSSEHLTPVGGLEAAGAPRCTCRHEIRDFR